MWNAGFYILLHGEETLKINWNEVPSGNLSYSGSFYNRLKDLSGQNPYLYNELEHMMESLGHFLYYTQTYDGRCEVSGLNGSCNVYGKEFNWSVDGNEMTVVFPSSTNKRVVLHFSGFHSNFFSRIKATVESSDNDYTNLKFELVMKECHRS